MKATLRPRLIGEQPVFKQTQTGVSSPPNGITLDQDYFIDFFYKNLINKWSGLIPRNWITEEATMKIALGQIPDLRSICLSLYNIFGKSGETKSVLHAIPVLQGLTQWPNIDWDTLTQSTSNSHLLIDNEIMKAVLIFWPKSKISSIHGHPKGGGVFKLLKGSIEELRYTSDESPKLLSVSTYQKGSVGFINDEMGYHAVGNPFDTPAVSIHVYTHQ